MALMSDDLFSENILDDPGDLERVEEDGLNDDFGVDDDPENQDEKKDDTKEDNEDKKEKIKRKTSQRPKLNILKLMDNNGLMSVEQIFKNVTFKGKGHEQEDLNLIMRKMEIWAHQLYPSLQFDDCLAKLEKLGTNKSVATYIKKIRMGMEDYSVRNDIVEPDDSDKEEMAQDSSNSNLFDQLLGTQNKQNTTTQATNPTSGLTVEQRERMLRNRMIAEQRRMARMKARQEELQMQGAIVENDNLFPPESEVVNNEVLP